MWRILRGAVLPGGDAAAAYPIRAAAGFLAQLDSLPDMTAPPFSFSSRYLDSLRLVAAGVRSFRTTSMGRLFDSVAALLGFTRQITFEGQAAMWVERLARGEATIDAYPFPFTGDTLDFRPLLNGVICDRLSGRKIREIARAFQRGIAEGVRDALTILRREHRVDTVVFSGGVFQNELLLSDLKALLESEQLRDLDQSRRSGE